MRTTFKNHTIPIKITDEMKVRFNLKIPTKYELCKTEPNFVNKKVTKRGSKKSILKAFNQSTLDNFGVTRKRKRSVSSVFQNIQFVDTKTEEIIIDDNQENPCSSSVEISRTIATCPILLDNGIIKQDVLNVDVEEDELQKNNFFNKIGLRNISDNSQNEVLSTVNTNDNDMHEISNGSPDFNKQRKINDLKNFNKENV
jgi:hypothetical protein